MKREIPQKVVTRSQQTYSPNGPHKPLDRATTLLRRTRSSTVVGLAFTLGIAGALAFPSQADAALSGRNTYYLGTVSPLSKDALTLNNPRFLPSTQKLDLAIRPTVATRPVTPAQPKSLRRTISPTHPTQSSFSTTPAPLSTLAPKATSTPSLSIVSRLEQADDSLVIKSAELFSLASNLVATSVSSAATEEDPQSIPGKMVNLLPEPVPTLFRTQTESTDQSFSVNPVGTSTPAENLAPPATQLTPTWTVTPEKLGLNLRESLSKTAEIKPNLDLKQINEVSAAHQLGVTLSHTIVPNRQKLALVASGAIVHHVQPGETLTDIASEYNVPTEQIAKTNRLDDPDLIDVDEAIRIPSNRPLAVVKPIRSSVEAAADSNDATLDAGVESSVLAVNNPAHHHKLDAELKPSSTDTKPIPHGTYDDLNQEEAWVDRPRQQADTSVSMASLNYGMPKSGGQVEPTAKFQTTVAKRLVLPRVPSLELPPLPSVDRYLPHSTGSQKYIWPAKGVLSSRYGWRWGRMHRGIDIAAPVGTTVVASAPGVIVTAGWNSGGYGNLVEIRHPDGSLTLYAHNNRINTRVGQRVYQGQKIAEMGSTGRSTGPHTHFELHPMGKGAVNPLQYLGRG